MSFARNLFCFRFGVGWDLARLCQAPLQGVWYDLNNTEQVCSICAVGKTRLGIGIGSAREQPILDQEWLILGPDIGHSSQAALRTCYGLSV